MDQFCVERVVERHRYLSIFVAAVALFVASPVRACNVPVFRYALERWKPDVYEAILFHDGELTPELDELVRRVRQVDDRGRPLTNLRLTTIDLRGELDDATKALWQAQAGAAAPWLVVRYPKALMLDKPLWSRTADRASVDGLLRSPARSELTRRLLAGESTVWVVIESGDANQDNKVLEMLGREFAKLQKSLKLPDESAQPGGVLKLPMNEGEDVLSRVPLRIAFSVLRVARDDPREAAFLANVLQTDEGLAADRGVVVLPVFGRGRALQAFPGEGLGAETIAGAEEFLCGECSCSVKTQNPGMDLLLTADWEAVLGENVAIAEMKLIETSATTLVAIPPGRLTSEAVVADSAQAPRSNDAGGRFRIVILATVTLTVVLVALASVLALSTGKQVP